jgi:hypothetical protein
VLRRCVVSWVVVAAGCSPAGTRAEPRVTIEVPEVRLRIDVPEGTEVSREGGVRLTLRPGTRHPRTLVITRSDESDAAPPGPAVRSSEAGMGGEQHELFGTVWVDERAAFVSCTEITEDGADLEWCITALATLRP